MEWFSPLPELDWMKSFYGWRESSHFSVEGDDAELQTQHLLPAPCSRETISAAEDKLQRLHPGEEGHMINLSTHRSPGLLMAITEPPLCACAPFKGVF